MVRSWCVFIMWMRGAGHTEQFCNPSKPQSCINSVTLLTKHPETKWVLRLIWTLQDEAPVLVGLRCERGIQPVILTTHFLLNTYFSELCLGNWHVMLKE